MDRRRFLVWSGSALTVPLAGCAGETDDDSADSGNDGSSDGGSDGGDGDGSDGSDGGDEGDGEETGDDESSEEQVDQPDPVSYSGSGSEVRDGLEIQGGLTVVEATHTGGSSNFQIELVPANGEYNALFANAIGEYDGVQAGLLDPDTYQVDVTADGDWEITVRQPRAASGDALPATLEEQGYKVLGPYEFSGNHTATGSHDGERNFIVEVFPQEGDYGEVVFNEIGQFEGETTFRADGLGWVAVQADGNWTVEME